eukprot:4821833-Pyramimonas_sp.AAC.1
MKQLARARGSGPFVVPAAWPIGSRACRGFWPMGGGGDLSAACWRGFGALVTHLTHTVGRHFRHV